MTMAIVKLDPWFASSQLYKPVARCGHV